MFRVLVRELVSVVVVVVVLVMVDVLVWVLSPAPDAVFPMSAHAAPETPNPMAMAVASNVFFIAHSRKREGAVCLLHWETSPTPGRLFAYSVPSAMAGRTADR
ncbi:hypothetical protein GO281_01446 [Ralstonia solanacearum]|nr:hypothetical protein [Ralstonia solanacearum]NKA57664.1 hypothetical protein [Ralstonia solanacearum]NKA91147.1 hypothetical protein [Ralstonia solanacearum]